MSPATYAVVTPARDDADNLKRLGAAMARQERAPAEWIVVDDASRDETIAVLAQLTADLPWLRRVSSGLPSAEALADGRRRGRVLDVLRRGLAARSRPVDVVIKVDADVDFDPGFLPGLADGVMADPRLAIAGGTCLELERGAWVARTVVPGAVRGATRAYRSEVLDVLDPLEARMGWDGLDEVAVGLRGWQTRTLPGLVFRHHRAVGARDRGRLQARAAQGHASWYMGYRPSYLLARGAYRTLAGEPSHLGLLAGYAAAAVGREPRCPQDELVAAIRERQRWRRLRPAGRPRPT